MVELSVQLEVELNVATVNEVFAENKVHILEKELEKANNRIKRLEEAENRLLNWLTEDCPESVKKQLSNAWIKYKEAKP